MFDNNKRARSWAGTRPGSRFLPSLETLESRLTPDASAQAVVTGLYHQVLLRKPDAAGLAAHTSFRVSASLKKALLDQI